MDFTPSHRLTSRLVRQPNPTSSASSQPIPVFAAVKRRSGLRNYPRCVFRGFYDPEVARGHPHMWTADQATVECYFSAATKTAIHLGGNRQHRPTGCDGRSLRQRRTSGARQKRFADVRRSAQSCPKPRVLTSLSLSINTHDLCAGTGVAAQCDDGRDLGIALRAIVFGKRRRSIGLAATRTGRPEPASRPRRPAMVGRKAA